VELTNPNSPRVPLASPRVTGTHSSLRASLNAFGPFDSRLLDADALDRVRALAERLPATLTRWMYLECRLHADDRIDLVMLVDRAAAAILLDRDLHTRLPRDLWERPAWKQVRELCATWLDDSVSWGADIDHLWLEFDCGVDATHDPGVFACVGEHRPAGYEPGQHLHALRGAARILLRECAEQRTIDAMLRRLTNELPPGAYVPYVGVMLQREDAALRCCVTRTGNAHMPAVIQRMSGSNAGTAHSALTSLLADVSQARASGPRCETTMWHLDLTAVGLGKRIGLEHTFDRLQQLHGRVGEARYLDWLVQQGWCTPAKRAGLDGWPAVRTCRQGAGRRRLVRLVNHIKLVVDESGAAHAKAYLACAHWPRVVGSTAHAS